jgi:hypothetical protein
LANSESSHEIPAGEPGSPINGLGRLERSSSPEHLKNYLE